MRKRSRPSEQRLEGIVDWPHTLNMIPSLRIIDLSWCQLDSANQSLPHLNLTKLEKLDLSWNYFEHSLGSGWFWKATSLKYLDLGQNSLFGQFPDTLGNMTYLQVLNVPQNGNSDMLMTENLKNLCSLEIIDLYGNEINGDIASVFVESLSQCVWKNLQKLDLSYNNFTGTLPNFISDFSRLSILSLSRNNLVGPIPPQLGNLTCLTSLDLSSNHLNGSIPTELGALTTLTSLNISSNDLTGSIPAELGNLRYLTELRLSYNNITAPIPPELRHSTSLTYLDLSSNHLNGSVPTQIGSLINLISLYLWNNSFTGVITEEHFANLTSLKYVDLSFNNLKIVLNSDWRTPFMLEYASFASCQMGPLFPPGLQQLKTNELDISSNALKGEIPDWFWSAFSNATYLDIANNQISGSLPAHMHSMAFEELHLNSNQLTGPIPTLPTKSICKLQQVVYLDMSNNILEGEVPKCFHFYKIEHLILNNNCLSGKIPAFLQNNTVDITKLGQLQYLDLSGNNFSGAIPWHLSNLTFMTTLQEEFRYMVSVEYESMGGTTGIGAGHVGEILPVITKGQQLIYGSTIAYFVGIDLSSNSLTGEIPTDITFLVALINLRLTANDMSGRWTHMIGAMQSLVSLDLSQNKLSGEIPSGMSNLTSLSYLNLSYNSLSGRIPSGRQLDTLNSENPSLMYIGNSGLCGPPVHKNCSGNDPSIHGDLESSKQEFEPLTFYFGLVLGFVVGLWMVFCALLFKKTWRIAYFWLFDEVYNRVYVFEVVKWASFTKNTDIE
ncbi:LRR receptor-like serine/threonine-protein kinase GSO1 [Triticum aestivum]|uniref:LRR receptor-like serine/threonine-protein kinase GSO1 n=1 Tax=Triticum aestivum TaxID=4565 RepID=UPI001D0304D2|nr:LRR receptor-like serine/threonine-protein kinase GSO1 [Triticum aestivum]